MRKLLSACAIAAVFAAASSVQAGQRQVGEIPNSQLTAMGLGDMQIVPDAQAANIRGKFRTINIRFPSAPKGFVNVFLPGLPIPIFFPERAIGILNRH